LKSARYRGQRSKPSPQHIHNRRILYIGELIRVAEIEDCIRVVTHPKNLPLGACMIEAFIYPVPKGEEYEAPRMRDCHGPLRGPRNDGNPPPPPPPPRGGGGEKEGGALGPPLPLASGGPAPLAAPHPFRGGPPACEQGVEGCRAAAAPPRGAGVPVGG